MFDKQDLIVFLFFLLLAIFLEFKYKLILLGSALIFFGPFIVIERFMIPFIKKYQKLSVVFGMLSAFGGCILLGYAFTL
jgi:lipid-A-disaccharide synthase-like uncharacterized protein